MSFSQPELLCGTGRKRQAVDFYATPAWATQALLLREEFIGETWEPACGDGAISKLLDREPRCNLISTDLFERGYGVGGIDFLKTKRAVSHVVTNPPYSLAERFVRHGLECAVDKVALLLKLNFLEGQRRKLLFDSTPLRTVYVFSKRVSFHRGIEGKSSGGLLAFAWFVWQRNYSGRPVLEWI